MDFKYPEPKPPRRRILDYLPLIGLVGALFLVYVKTQIDERPLKTNASSITPKRNGDAPPPGETSIPRRRRSRSFESHSSDRSRKAFYQFDRRLNPTRRAPRRRGLLGQYYAISNPIEFFDASRNVAPRAKDLLLRRIDLTLDFSWDVFPPAEKLPFEYYQARWTGLLAAPNSGVYRLQVEADDGVRLFIDGQKLLDQWTVQPATTFQVAVPLGKGWHHFRLDYFQAEGRALLRVSWDYPFGAGFHAIPSSCFGQPREL
jgi:hypothetical protein